MNGKKLVGMGIALAVLVALAVVQNKGVRKGRPSPARDAATLLQGVDLNAVDALAVSKGTNAVALARKGDQWVVESLHGHPADFARLAGALRAAAEVKLGSPVRSANVDPAEFGLDAEAKRIELEAAGTPVASVEVGARRAGSGSSGWANQHFVRTGGSDGVFLVDYDFRPFSDDPADWIPKDLLDVRSADIVSVSAGDVALKVDGADWTLADLDAGTEELETEEAGKLRRALQYLRCTTVADPSLSDADLGFTNAVVYTAQTTNQAYTVKIGGVADGGGRHVRFEGDAPARLAGWTYVVSDYDAADFLVGREQLVRKKEPPPEEGVAEGGAATSE